MITLKAEGIGYPDVLITVLHWLGDPAIENLASEMYI